MTLADFMDTSYALIVEERQRINPLTDMLSLAEELNPRSAKVERIPRQGEVKAQNEQSMALLQGMMGNVQNSPVKKPRRTR